MRLRLKDDSGQGMLPLMVLVALTLLAITFSLLVPWGAATTEKAQAQTAADAAALAEADEKRGQWFRAVAPGEMFYGPLGRTNAVAAVSVTTCEQAEFYADQNGAHYLDCRRTTRDGAPGVSMLVEADTTSGENGRAEARSTAVIDLDLSRGRCGWTNPVPELPPPPVGTGPPSFDRTFRCGEFESTYRVVNAPPLYPTVPGELEDREGNYERLEPRLVRTDLF